jgi:exopolysaccharide production protein ExoZ
VGIQVLRAVAASMVVAHHALLLASDQFRDSVVGSRGVDLFFVISGFVMALSTAKLDTRAPWLSEATRFWLRRILRIVPLWWLALLWMSKSMFARGEVDAGLLGDFLFWPRFHPAHPDQIWPWLVPGWTLGYEMLFYLLFGLSMAFGRWRHGAAVLLIGALVVAGMLVDPVSAIARFATREVMLEFVLGIGVWKLLARWPASTMPRAAAFGVALGGLALLGVDNHGMPRALADGVPAALVVWGGVVAARGLRLPVLERIGDASYSTYLCQVFVFGWMQRLMQHPPSASPSVTYVVTLVAIALVACTATGWAVHRLIERPLQALLDPRRRTARRAAAMAA